MKLTLGQVADWIHADGEFDTLAEAVGYGIDSRTIGAGELFFAVRGERLDGHDFVEQALGKGAIAAVVQKDQVARFPTGSRLMAVEDTLKGLQTLATAVRRLWAKPLVGVTGSTGKTTTKEAIAHLLASRFRVMKSEGNFNNHFGLPLALLQLEPEHDIAVIEMGMSHRQEITALAAIAQPNIGVVTNVSAVHMEFFSSVAEIARAKYELIESLPAGATAVLNSDDEYVSQFGRDFHGKVVLYGLRSSADVRAEKIESHGIGSTFELVVGGCRENVSLQLVGTHNIYNALAAVAVGLEHGLRPSEAVAALKSLAPAEKRGQVIEVGNITVINDCYNSNPKALEAMVDAIAAMPAGRRIVVAGEMLELGSAAEEMHRSAGRHMAARKIDILVGVRGLAEAMVQAAGQAGIKAQFVIAPQEAGEWLAREARDGDVVLMKASRGVKLEQALESWQAHKASTTN